MFEKEYQKKEAYWGRKPDKIVRLISKYKSFGEVLDLGAGEGKNSIFLAKGGFKVTSLDISKEGIKK